VISRFKIKISIGAEERWADADKVFAHLMKNYMKAELNGKKPEPYTDKVNNFFDVINEEWKTALKESYPNVDIDQQLKNAKMWLLSNTHQAKSNFKKFINNWMAKAMRTGKVEPADGRTKQEFYKPADTPEEDLASQEEINEMMQKIKNKLRR
tara:strand:+ start:2063 stop:2521 length:459 start_codon:yes stop_codon:yes gene_type:complete